jgi:hypothetical protein
MKRFVLALSCALAMVPGVASAALSINIGPDVLGYPGSSGYFDLVFNETGTPEDEGLFAYDLYLVRDRPGINLIRAEKPDNWVFTAPVAEFQEAGPEFSNKPGLIVVNAIGYLLSASEDIVSGTKAARVYYTIDPDAPPGVYRIGLDPASTLFVSGDTGAVIPIDIADRGTVTVWPEPTGLSLALIAGGALALRRCRRVA